MTEYNIYAGPKGKVIYLYTTLCDNLLAATYLAKQELQYEYCTYNGNKDYEDALQLIADCYLKAGVECFQEDVGDKASKIYNEWLDSWGEYKAIETSEDDIIEEDLIRDYVSSNC